MRGCLSGCRLLVRSFWSNAFLVCISNRLDVAPVGLSSSRAHSLFVCVDLIAYTCSMPSLVRRVVSNLGFQHGGSSRDICCVHYILLSVAGFNIHLGCMFDLLGVMSNVIF